MSQVDDCLAVIHKAVGDFVPQVGMVLGSGLGTFADQVDAVASIGFDDLQVFPKQEWAGTQGGWCWAVWEAPVWLYYKAERITTSMAKLT